MYLVIFSMLFLTLSITSALAEEPSEAVEVDKWLRCPGDTGYSSNPPYYVGEKLYFWMRYRITAIEDLTGVVLFDRFGAELMIEGIIVDYSYVELPANQDDDNTNDVYEYTFTYTPYAEGGAVTVDGASGTLDKDGVQFDDFEIFWTGKSVKVHLQWNVGDMSAGEKATMFVIVSTDTNPAGKPEYTSPGTYMLNSGATVKALLASTLKQVSAVSDTIEIEVE